MDIETDPSSRDLAEYLEIPLRYWKHAFLPFLAVVLLAVAAIVFLPKKYKSSTLIMLESNRVSAAMNTNRLVERLGTIKQEIQSRTQLEKVLDELQPYAGYGDMPLYRQVEEMRLATHIRVQGDDAFFIEYVHRDPETAMNVTNRLASLFIENTGKLREAAVQEARGFTQTTLDEAKQMLETAERDLRHFKDQYIGALPEQLDANLATLARLQLEKHTVEAGIQAAEQRRDFLLSTITSQDSLSPRTSVDLQELQTLKENLDQLRLRYTELHPDVQALESRIEVLENQLTAAGRARREAAANAGPSESIPFEEIPTDATAPIVQDGSIVLGGIELDLADPKVYALYAYLQRTSQELESAHRSRDDLDQQISDFQARVELTPRIEAQLYTLERDHELRRENYDLMLRKNLEAEMAERLEAHWQAGLFRILDPANLSERPVSPNVALFILAGLFFGGLAAIVTSGLADYMDHSVKNVRQLEALLPFPVLVTVPHAGKAKKSSKIYR